MFRADHSKMAKYLSEILIIQLLATYLVILGHSCPFITEIPGWLQKAQIFIYCFHMPLFVFISGYLLIYTSQSSKRGTKEFIQRRFMKLIIPYISLSLIALVPKFYIQQFLNDSIRLDTESLMRVFFVPRENVWGHFWFLPMIFIQGIVGFILDRLFVKVKIKKIGWFLTTVALFILYVVSFHHEISRWLSASDLAKFSWFFSLGCFCASYNLLERLRLNHAQLISIILIASSLGCFAATNPWNLNAIEQASIAILMISALLLLCVSLSDRINFSRDAIYAQTFTIFLLSWPCQILINVTAERLLHWQYYIIMPLQFLAGIIGPIILIYILNYIERKHNIHWISFLLGK